MAVDQPKVVDIISKDKNGDIVLTISDHLDWRDTRQHLTVLQEKINDYLAFLESGEIYKKYPNARGNQIRIKVVFQYKPTPETHSFLREAKSIVEGAGAGFGHELFAATPYKM